VSAPLADAQARRRIREDLDTTFFVEAAAGTGKTSELVARIVAAVRAGRSTLDNLVAVTFTEKAAGEMKLRLREEIERARALEPEASAERARFDAALEHLEVVRAGTLHAFCADLLRERPIEAGVDPLFEVAPEDEAERLLDAAFNAWFESALADPPEGVRRVLRRRPRGRDAQGPRAELRGALRALAEHRDFAAPWRREPFDREQAIDRLIGRLETLGALARRAAWAEDYLAKNLAEIARWTEELALRETVRARDYDGLEAELRELARSRQVHWHWRGSARRPYAPDLPRAEVIAEREAVKSELDAFVAAADADLAAALREELRPALDRYEALKARSGKLDFLDLLLRARALVREDDAVRARLQARFTHFFVDEFQDTDPLQAELLLLLAADEPAERDWRRARPQPGKLFLVGDPKQSIYRFRRADVGVYETVKRLLAERGAEVLYLRTSFRSRPAIQRAVNAAFAPVMAGAGQQAHYVPLEPFREDPPGQPAVVALPVPRPYGDYGTIVHWRIDRSLPDATGAFVDWLLRESGWTVEEGGAQVPVAARHVCLLFRRLRKFWADVTRDYVRALEAREIPHVLVGGHSFHEREEVLAMRNALAAIEWPDDELRVFATLRSPLFGLGDDALLAYRDALGSPHPLRRADPEALDAGVAEVAEALALLGRLHARRNRRPIADTVGELLDTVRAHAGIAIWAGGEQALANCLRVIDMARRFERRGAPSFRAFVELLEREAERGEAQAAPLVEEGTEGVRIMTVHKAKGLEFPVVVLADPTCRRTRETPTRHVDPARGLWAEPIAGCAPRDLLDARDEELARDEEEAARLAYVAATRARDLLVVPVCGDEPLAGWLDVLNPVLYPPPERAFAATPAPGCPPFGADSVLERSGAAASEGRRGVAPGLHRPQAGEHAVVWWDPRALGLDRREPVGLGQTRVLEADRGGGAAQASRDGHARWQARRRQALAAGAVPSLAVEPVTAHARAERGHDAAAEPAIEHLEVALERAGRPRGRRFGTLVHAVLAAIELDAGGERVLAATRLQARLVGCDEPEVEAAAAAVSAALEHPLLVRAARAQAAGRLYREAPVLLALGEEAGEPRALVEGVVDLAFREMADGAPLWTVVDFKTDRELGERRAEYESQVRLYATAIARATGEPARGVLLSV